MKISDSGIKILSLREGSRKKAYKCSAGVWTIGVGHTGPEVHEGMVISEQQIADYLREDIKIVEECIASKVKVVITQNQYDSLCSFIFNVGVGAFSRSTMLRMLNGGDLLGAYLQFDRWVIPKEITSRRMSEKAQFITP